VSLAVYLSRHVRAMRRREAPAHGGVKRAPPPSRHARPTVCPRAAPRPSADFWLSVQRLGTIPVPQIACPALDLIATALSRPSTARNVSSSRGTYMAPSPAARGTPKVGVAVSAGRGEAVLGFPVPARRSADSQRSTMVVWRRAVHATLYALNFRGTTTRKSNVGKPIRSILYPPCK